MEIWGNSPTYLENLAIFRYGVNKHTNFKSYSSNSCLDRLDCSQFITDTRIKPYRGHIPPRKTERKKKRNSFVVCKTTPHFQPLSPASL